MYTEPGNVWAADPFWAHVHEVIDTDKELTPQVLSEDEVIAAYLLVWISMSLPAGVA